MTADLTHVETWLFDLDNTLYPAECEFMTLVEGRMTQFVARETGLPAPDALALQKKYLFEHGTTLAGLMAHHGVDPERFLEEVHDVALDRISLDAELASALARLPGRRLVFTNGSARHAERVLGHMGLAELFEDVFHIAAADYVPKPSPETFEKLAARHAVVAGETAFFEDSERNLKPAAELGMTTVLVGANAGASTAAFVHHRTHDLAGFLTAARLRS
ncbi:MAG TPA: pyrimidine 5'-nucleotidase [Caulobacteraceae bacterium]